MTSRSSVAYRTVGSRKTLTGSGESLVNINTTPLDDGARCYVTSDGSDWQLHRGSTATPSGTVIAPSAGPGRWIKTASGSEETQAFIIRADIADLTARDSAALPNGCQAYVVSEQQSYQLDTANPLTTYSPLIVARGAGAGAGKWYRQSRAYVVGNFTLWCQSFGFGVVGFTPGQLLTSSSTEPDIVLSLGTLHPTSGQQVVLPDSFGNLWLGANNGAFTGTVIRKYLLEDCLVSGAPSPAVTITPPAALTEAGNLAFDSRGGLWSANGTHGAPGQTSFVRFGARAYSQSNGVPGLTLTAAASDPTTSNQQDQVFDGEGNLWFSVAFTGAAGGVNGGIGMFSAEQVATGGTVAPAVLWAGSNFGVGALGSVIGLAVAPNGLLWGARAYSGTNSLDAWTMENAASGNPAPAVSLTSSAFVNPYGLAFDSSGNLWVSNAGNNKILRVPAASLAASGAVVPDVIISPVNATMFSRLTFPRNPDRLPLLSGFPPG